MSDSSEKDIAGPVWKFLPKSARAQFLVESNNDWLDMYGRMYTDIVKEVKARATEAENAAKLEPIGLFVTVGLSIGISQVTQNNLILQGIRTALEMSERDFQNMLGHGMNKYLTDNPEQEEKLERSLQNADVVTEIIRACVSRLPENIVDKYNEFMDAKRAELLVQLEELKNAHGKDKPTAVH